MGWDISRWVLLGLLALLLVSAGVEDARKREIANWKNAAIALLALPWWWAHGLAFWPDMAIQLGIAAGVFALFVGLFALGCMGGGDVKLIGALALWLPLGALVDMLVVMSVAGGVLTLAMIVQHKRTRSEAEIEVPYGIAIAFAAFLALGEPILNQLH